MTKVEARIKVITIRGASDSFIVFICVSFIVIVRMPVSDVINRLQLT